MPFPHSGQQVPGPPPLQVYPDSTKQVLEHPSPLTTFPSSQVSDTNVTIEFPQTTEHDPAPVPVHPYPGSTTQ